MQLKVIPVDKDRRETTLHGPYEFPLAIYHTDLSLTVLGYVNWHWHEELQFCLVTAGAVRFFTGGGQYVLHAGEGIFIGSGCLHMAKPETAPDSVYVCLDLHPRLLASFSGSVFERSYVAPFLTDPDMAHVPLSKDVPWQREVLSSIPAVDRLYRQKAFGYEYEIGALLARMWLCLLRNKKSGDTPRLRSKRGGNAAVQAMMTYLEGHCGERITMEAVAAAAAFSQSECCRIFKSVTGQTIFSYLQSFRLSKGAGLLRSTALPVSRIAYEIGFCSTSYFIEVFRRQFGMTPLQYRKRTDVPAGLDWGQTPPL